MSDCPCKDKNNKVVIHSKGLYTKPYKKPCNDCAKKKTLQYSITSNTTKRRGR